MFTLSFKFAYYVHSFIVSTARLHLIFTVVLCIRFAYKLSFCLRANHPTGFIEYWSPGDYKAPPSSGPGAVVKFSLKMDTDLFALAKAKTYARTLEVSPAKQYRKTEGRSLARMSQLQHRHASGCGHSGNMLGRQLQAVPLHLVLVLGAG
jgi:hypothetical protein